jgi:hypothetical protein
MRALLYATCLGAVYSWAALAQQSAFQSGDGRTSVYLDSSAAVVNFTDTKFSVGYIDRTSDKKLFTGFELFAKASSGITTLLVQKIKVPEAGGDFSLGEHHLLSAKPLDPQKKVSDDWLLLDVGYSRSSAYVQSAPGSANSSQRSFDRYRLIADYNALFNTPKLDILLGVAAGAERRNNLDDLTQVTFETSVVPAAAGSAATVQKTQAGYSGQYRQYVAAPIYTDVLLILPSSITLPGIGSRIGIDGFTRSDVAAFNRSVDGGLGLFLTKKDAPTKVQGGLSASWNGGKVRIALVAGLNF